MSAAILVTVAVALVWVAVEGRTILVTAAALRPRAAGRLDRLGWGFLATESWTLALLGLAHATLPAAVHAVYGAVPWAPAAFVGGWMVRDLGLWLRRRSGPAPGWTAVAGLGACLQGVAALAVAGTFLLVRPEVGVAAGASLLASVAPPVLAVGVLLQWWLLRIRATARRGSA